MKKLSWLTFVFLFAVSCGCPFWNNECCRVDCANGDLILFNYFSANDSSKNLYSSGFFQSSSLKVDFIVGQDSSVAPGVFYFASPIFYVEISDPKTIGLVLQPNANFSDTLWLGTSKISTECCSIQTIVDFAISGTDTLRWLPGQKVVNFYK